MNQNKTQYDIWYLYFHDILNKINTYYCEVHLISAAVCNSRSSV